MNSLLSRFGALIANISARLSQPRDLDQPSALPIDPPSDTPLETAREDWLATPQPSAELDDGPLEQIDEEEPDDRLEDVDDYDPKAPTPEQDADSHRVDVLAGSELPLRFLVKPGKVTAWLPNIWRHASAWDDEDDEGWRHRRQSFPDGAAAADWVRGFGVELPSQFEQALRLGSLGTPRSWAPTVDDALAMPLTENSLRATWSLAWENAEGINEESFGSLGEAFEALGDVGALATRVGTSARLYLGSIEIWSTHAQFHGHDQAGDPQNVSAKTLGGSIFQALEARENLARVGAKLAAGNATAIPPATKPWLAPSDNRYVNALRAHPQEAQILDNIASAIKNAPMPAKPEPDPSASKPKL